MAVQLNLRSNPVQGANAQATPYVPPAPVGVASTPDAIASQADDSCCFCGWIIKLCEWIKSLFFSSAPAAHVFTLEQRIQKGRQFIDQVLVMPPFNRDRTVLVCALSYNGHYEVPFGRLEIETVDDYKQACYQRLENLLRNNQQVADGTLSVVAYYVEKLPNGTHFHTCRKVFTIEFTRDIDFSSSGNREGFNETMDEIRNRIREICGPALVEAVNSTQLINNF